MNTHTRVWRAWVYVWSEGRRQDLTMSSFSVQLQP